MANKILDLGDKKKPIDYVSNTHHISALKTQYLKVLIKLFYWMKYNKQSYLLTENIEQPTQQTTINEITHTKTNTNLA